MGSLQPKQFPTKMSFSHQSDQKSDIHTRGTAGLAGIELNGTIILLSSLESPVETG